MPLPGTGEQATLSAILLTFNERENVVPLLKRLTASLADVPHEMIVVDDDSADGTAAMVERFAVTRDRSRGSG